MHKKVLKFAALEKSADDLKPTGYLSTYDNSDSDGDVMLAGCFDKTIKAKPVVPILYQHDRYTLPVGVGKLSTDDKGLRIECELNAEVQMARECAALIKQGALDAFSFGGFIDYSKARFENGLCYVAHVEVFEASITPFPANDQARIDAKSQKADNALAELSAAILILNSRYC